ncbi:histidine kinase [Paenibacillus caseinilyticus]|uniref:histidine kinase n=1 Tax=Paenibacillus mucilaginosus K02 TaxID=997761 RepID=I0BBS3_9BACL|nr:sensor histidine kinase [Paenibacillus mucilaginosus]AFH59820.1 membrane protein [Paenibacillus mucilaginosus K02]
MTIRRKLLLFLPLLVLLMNTVTYFLFESGKVVQRSYDEMMSRILLYKQSVQAAETHLSRLYTYLLDPAERNGAALTEARAGLAEARSLLTQASATSPVAPAVNAYTNLLGTLMEQEEAALTAAKPPGPGASTALVAYGEAERTAGFIREEGLHLVDLELSSYQPVYREIREENGRINRLGAAIIAVNTLLSLAAAVWISRSITGPVSRLVAMAREIARGNLRPEPPPPTGDELGILSDAFQAMLADLAVLIGKEKESLEKDRLLKELELQALQSQINPHFLFNTLNVLSKLALLEGAERTSDLIVSMSNLLRYNLGRLDRPVTLRDELQHLQEYVTIQQARFRDRVRFELEIDEDALQAGVPSLTLQPLVENAFQHGIADLEQGAVIRVTIARLPADEVSITVADNGAGMSEEVRQSLLRLEGVPEPKQSTGLGTRNVFKRLALYYGRDDLVTIESAPDQGTRITLHIPIGKEKTA